MTDEEALKAQVDELMENLNFYLRYYNRLIGIGYKKAILDAEISFLEEKLKQLSNR